MGSEPILSSLFYLLGPFVKSLSLQSIIIRKFKKLLKLKPTSFNGIKQINNTVEMISFITRYLFHIIILQQFKMNGL